MATRKKSKPGLGRYTGKLIKAGVIVLVFAGSGWWLFASNSDNKVRKTVLGRLSLLADRMDEVSQVWKDREVPGSTADKQTTVEKPAVKKTPQPKTSAPVSAPAPQSEPAPEPKPVVKAEPKPAPVKPAPGPKTTQTKTTTAAQPAKTEAKPASDVSREDQQQLENFFKQLK